MVSRSLKEEKVNRGLSEVKEPELELGDHTKCPLLSKYRTYSRVLPGESNHKSQKKSLLSPEEVVPDDSEASLPHKPLSTHHGEPSYGAMSILSPTVKFSKLNKMSRLVAPHTTQ